VKGNFAHEVLEVWVKRLLKGEDARKSMLAAYREILLSEDYAGKVENYLAEIQPWLKQAIAQYQSQGFKPLMAEETVKFRYRNIMVTGRIDRIDHVNPGTVKIIDYKSTKNPAYLTDLQLGMYHMGVKYGSLRDLYGNKEVEATYILLRHDMREVPYKFTVENLEDFLDEIEEVSEQIRNETEWVPKPSNLCKYCDYFIPCTKERERVDDWW
jgi:RecB family exonuclease